LGSEDGIDPRDWDKADLPPVRNRKSLQLCRQVSDALHLAFAGCGDSILNDLLVIAARPAPDSSRILVVVQSATGSGAEAGIVQAHLHRAIGMLRSSVAAAIHRRKTPELVFVVAGNP
jgi:ribosome-binding factor A